MDLHLNIPGLDIALNCSPAFLVAAIAAIVLTVIVRKRFLQSSAKSVT